jgi:hypothetical protein
VEDSEGHFAVIEVSYGSCYYRNCVFVLLHSIGYKIWFMLTLWKIEK